MNQLQLFKPSLKHPSIEPLEALPFEGDPPEPKVFKRRTYVTLERAIKYGITPGCKGCERIAEGVPHTDECRERFRVCLEEERLAAKARAEGMRVPPTPRTPAVRESAPGTPAMPALDSSEFKGGGDGDFWEFDTDRKAWNRVHVRPRKKLFAPVGRDCPFDVSDVSHERLTEWKCRGKISVHKDDWNKCPYQRISSKSWVGSTWFFPRDPFINESQAKLFAATANLLEGEHNAKPGSFECLCASMLAESPDPTKLAEEILKATEGVPEAKTPKDKCKIRDRCRTCFEFCCSKNSSLGEVNMDRGINHFRLSIDQTDMSNDVEVDCLINVMHQFKGADLYGSIPCGPWSSWQRLNCQQYGKRFQQKLKKDRKKSLKILRNYIRCAEVIMQNGGHCAFEWPKSAEGWKIPELLQFVKRNRLFVSEPQGCAFGMCDKNNVPHLKTWRIVTSCWKLAKNLDAHKCKHEKGFKHAPLEGSATPKSAFYPMPMARCISYSLYEADIPAMPVELESEPVGHEEFSPDEVLAAVHLLLNRNEWHKHQGWEEAIQKEASGINANNTWSFDEVISRSDLIARSKAKGEAINMGKLMTILSVKNFETPELRKLKARIVFRGDDIRNADNTLAVLQEAKVNPTGLAGINLNLVYGALHGHKTTQSDVTRAYTQSLLKTKVPTWVELPRELTPKEYSHLERPCVRLVRAS